MRRTFIAASNCSSSFNCQKSGVPMFRRTADLLEQRPLHVNDQRLGAGIDNSTQLCELLERHHHSLVPEVVCKGIDPAPAAHVNDATFIGHPHSSTRA